MPVYVAGVEPALLQPRLQLCHLHSGGAAPESLHRLFPVSRGLPLRARVATLGRHNYFLLSGFARRRVEMIPEFAVGTGVPSR